MKKVLKIVKSLEDPGLLLKGVSKSIKNEAKEQKEGFLSMLLGILGASLLGNMLAGKGFTRAGEGTAIVGYDLRGLQSKDLHEYSDIRTHWIALYVNNKTVTYLDSSGVEHIPKQIKKFINNKNIISKFFRIQAYDSVM